MCITCLVRLSGNMPSFYINDLPTTTKAESYLYADDTTVATRSVSLDVLAEQHSLHFTQVIRWFDANKLTVNDIKTEHLLITNRNHNFDNPPSVKLIQNSVEANMSHTYAKS